MRHTSAVTKAIEDNYENLSQQQRCAADYLLANRRTAFALSVQELARETKVSEATIVRFAREVGFGGYLELRNALMQEAKQDLSPEDRFATEERGQEPKATLVRIANQEVQNIERTVEEVDAKVYQRFIARLRKTPTVATIGLGVSAALARIAAYLLFQIGVRAEALGRDMITLSAQIEMLPKDSGILAFSYPPYSKDTIVAAQSAIRRRLPVLAITDSVRSPVRSVATATLYAYSDNVLFTNSISSPMLLINSLVTDLALANKKRALQQLRVTTQASKEDYVK